MESNNITFTSGEQYTLANLFSNDNKIIIPDLQRDYCWGNKAWNKDLNKNVELVSPFLEGLLESFIEDKQQTLTLGLIYAYQTTKNNIQLCDGQQRITTLFLILGVINIKTNNYFQDYLISQYELNNNDKTPYLQYSIRESTLYFLSDLVTQVFIQIDNTKYDFNKIIKESWYFSEYNLDSSILSMIEALKIIDNILKDQTLNLIELGDFILNNLQMLYYDMENRARGEETFVIINTTGEPLTATENLKPIIIGKILDAKEQEVASNQWEEREEWFWVNKKEKESTSDEGMNQFFNRYWQIRLLQERSWKDKVPSALNPRELFIKSPKVSIDNEENPTVEKWEESISPITLHKYFTAFKKVIELSKEDDIVSLVDSILQRKNSQTWFRDIDINIILPLISYLEKFEGIRFVDFFRRLRTNFFNQERKRQNFLDWRYIIQIIELSKNEEDLFTFNTLDNKDIKQITNIPLNVWYDNNEQLKNSFKQISKKAIENWEDHIDLMGDLSPIWNSFKGQPITFDLAQKRFQIYDLLYNCYIPEISATNPILSNYVRLFRVLIEDQLRIDHINYSSGMLGAWFSWMDINDLNYFNYLKNEEFITLLTLEKNQIIDHIKNRIKVYIKKEDLNFSIEDFQARNHLKYWLLLKTLRAEKLNLLLFFYDDKAIATYLNGKDNRLNNTIPLSLANSICGYGIKSGGGKGNFVRYAREDFWGNESCFDTLIGNYVTLEELENKEIKPIGTNKIEAIENEITLLINNFYSISQ